MLKSKALTQRNNKVSLKCYKGLSLTSLKYKMY